MTIHQKINAKGNLKRWLFNTSRAFFHKKVAEVIRSGYAWDQEHGNTILRYPQDTKTNHREP